VPDTKAFWELGIDLKKPICYVLKTNSIFDLLILDIHCRKNKLPRPIAVLDNLGVVKDAATVYLSEVGVLRNLSWEFEVLACSGVFHYPAVTSFAAESLALEECSLFLKRLLERNVDSESLGKWRKIN